MRESPDMVWRTDAQTNGRAWFHRPQRLKPRDQKLSNKHQQTGRNWSKMVKNLNLSPQAMYFWPQNGQNGQNKNFPRHNTAIKWFKATFPSFWPRFRQIWCAESKKMSKNLFFWLKMAKNGKNWPFLAKISKSRIFFKNPPGTFF